MTLLSHLRHIDEYLWVATASQYQTNSTVIAEPGGDAILVDPAWYPDEIAHICADVHTLGLQIVAGFATHEDYDHVLWHTCLPTVPRWASPRTTHRLHQNKPAICQEALDFTDPDNYRLAGQLTAMPAKELPWSGPLIQVLEHDGHVPGHCALWLADRATLIAGDMLSDVELPMPHADDIGFSDYLAALSLLRTPARLAQVLVPGHGSVTSSGWMRWLADWKYLHELLRHGSSQDQRIQLPGMEQVHETNLALARNRTSGA